MTLSSARPPLIPGREAEVDPDLRSDRDARSSLEEAVAALRARLERGPPVPPIDEDRLERIEIPIDGIDPLAFLAAQAPGERMYVRSREGALEIAGLGAAARYAGLADPSFRRLRAAEPRITAILAERFDPDRASAREWSAFPLRMVVIPRVELRREGTHTTLALHLGADAHAALEALERLHTSVEEMRDAPRPVTFAPGFGVDSSPEAWRGAVEATLANIASGAVRKLVLARTRRFDLPEALDPCALLARLGEGEPGTYRFLIEPEPGVAFLGASPERLFRREGRKLHSEAVAGTRPRGETPDADAALAAQLFESDKEQNEHAFVLDRIRERLGPLSGAIRAEGRPRVLRLASVQHLATSIEADLTDADADAELLARLHPTPAVCGEPLDRARAIIRDCEPFDRGLYAGPVGVAGATTDVCVAIRSALVVGRAVTAFAGAGIVAGSSVEEEWRETEHKLATFERIVFGPRA